MNEQITGLASLGRFEDDKIAHVADGEMVIPPLAISLATKRQIFKDMLNAGINPANYVVGSSNSINPYSGLPEFFLKKLVKKIIKPVKKVVKFQTGLAKKAVKANLKLGKKIVKSDLFKTLAPIGAMFIPGLGPLASMALSGGLAGLGSGGGLKAGLTGALTGTLGGLAGGLRPGMAPNVPVGSNPFSSFDSFKQAINPFSGLSQNVSNQSGIMGLGQSDPIMQLVSNLTGGDDIYNQQRLQNFYNKGMGAAAGLAVPAGILSYLAAKKERDNPLKDVRDTLRPDLKLGATFGKGGFDLGFAEGGEVLDMRDGGESEGPGTGTSDDIPAMLSDGEFVMTASANNGIGGYKITKEKDSLTLIPRGKPSRKEGAKNMMNLMKTFEKYNEGYA